MVLEILARSKRDVRMSGREVIAVPWLNRLVEGPMALPVPDDTICFSAGWEATATDLRPAGPQRQSINGPNDRKKVQYCCAYREKNSQL
jgi:hypothetical protein